MGGWKKRPWSQPLPTRSGAVDTTQLHRERGLQYIIYLIYNMIFICTGCAVYMPSIHHMCSCDLCGSSCRRWRSNHTTTPSTRPPPSHTYTHRHTHRRGQGNVQLLHVRGSMPGAVRFHATKVDKEVYTCLLPFFFSSIYVYAFMILKHDAPRVVCWRGRRGCHGQSRGPRWGKRTAAPHPHTQACKRHRKVRSL